MKVGVRELKDRLSSFLARVRNGERIEVTHRGEVVAELHRPEARNGRTEVPPGLARLAARGRLVVGAPNDPALYPVPERVLPEGTAQTLLDEDRGER